MSTNPRKNIARRKRIHKRLKTLRAKRWFKEIDPRVIARYMLAEWNAMRREPSLIRIVGQMYGNVIIDEADDPPHFHTLWPHPDAPRSPVDGA